MNTKKYSGSLYLDGCTALTALPEGLSVGGSLYLAGCTALENKYRLVNGKIARSNA